MIKIVISANSKEELREKLADLAIVMGAKPSITDTSLAPSEGPEARSEAGPIAVEKKKRGRKAKAESAPAANTVEEKSSIDVSKLREESKTTSDEVYGRSPQVDALEKTKAHQEAPAPTSPTLTFADVRSRLKELCDVGPNGTKAGHDILTGFGAQRLSALKEADYPAFVEKCKEALAKL